MKTEPNHEKQPAKSNTFKAVGSLALYMASYCYPKKSLNRLQLL